MSITLANDGFFGRSCLPNRNDYIRFLQEHTHCFAHINGSSLTYANDVRVTRLGLEPYLESYALNFINAECPEYKASMETALLNFWNSTGYIARFCGGSNGYLTLMYDAFDKDGQCLAVDDSYGFSSWTLDDIANRVHIVQLFDDLCDELRDILLWYLENTELTEVTEVVTTYKTIAVLTSSDNPYSV